VNLAGRRFAVRGWALLVRGVPDVEDDGLDHVKWMGPGRQDGPFDSRR
jgi:hypothetical protein